MLSRSFSNSFVGRLLGLRPVYNCRLRLPQVRTTHSFLRPYISGVSSDQSSSALDLGCGSKPQNPFLCSRIHGVDFESYDSPCITSCDLSKSLLPFEDSSFNVVTAFDLVEHIPRVAYHGGNASFPFVDLMSEVFRVLKPGGYFFSKTPAHPFPQAYVDPTHVNIITEDTFPFYFSHACRGRTSPEAARYGFVGSFACEKQAWWGGGWLLSLLKKPLS